MKKYEAVIFDLDGTLLNTLDDLAGSVNAVLKTHGFPEVTLKDVRSFVGNGVAKLIELAIPGGLNNPLFGKCLEEFKVHYSEHMEILTAPYPGIPELLKELSEKQFKIAVVSNKFDKAVKNLCKVYFSDDIYVAIGESKEVKKKPEPDTVFKALKEMGIQRDRALYVGDSEVDILTAKNAGIPCVSVSWGFRDKDFLTSQGAEYIIDSPYELLPIL